MRDKMIFLGSLVNGAAIAAGSFAGAVFRNISEQTKDTITKGIGLGVIVLGLQMALTADSFILITISLCLGAAIGEFLKIEDGMNRFGLFLERHFAKSGSNFAEGFVTSTLIYVIGSMGIIGAIQSGISGDHQTLYTKAVLDGFMSVMLTASLGYGVLFSAFPVLIYQGSLSLLAYLFASYIPDHLLDILMAGISAIGGILIVAIGLNIIKLAKIRVSNFLPSILVLVFFLTMQYYFF